MAAADRHPRAAAATHPLVITGKPGSGRSGPTLPMITRDRFVIMGWVGGTPHPSHDQETGGGDARGLPPGAATGVRAWRQAALPTGNRASLAFSSALGGLLQQCVRELKQVCPGEGGQGGGGQARGTGKEHKP